MKLWLCFILSLIIVACGEKNSDKDSIQKEEATLAIGSNAECNRARELQGSNSVFHWETAATGNLQSIIIDVKTKRIFYKEATAGGFFSGESTYQFKDSTFYFKTKSKSLKLTFPKKPTGIIENDLLGKEYVVSILTYHDGSGFHDPFLCPKL